jgi:uncharacterized protein (DUF1015 family)
MPAAPEPPGLVLAPFRGVRYAQDRVSGLAKVTSPPYDVINPGSMERLFAEDPHNVVRLILPTAGADGGADGYRLAADTLRDWLADGVLAADSSPALYVYEQAGPDADTGQVIQRGLIGAVGLSAPGAGTILPHEDVMPGPVSGRRALMETTQANLEAIFLLYESAGGASGPPGAAARLVDEVATTREPLVSLVTGDDEAVPAARIRHRLWAVTDPAEHAAVAADLAGRRALIADGHHRYAAYLDLQARRHAAGDGPGPWDFGLALLVESTAYPPRLGAIHRVLPGLPPARAVELAKAAFSARPLPAGSGGPGGSAAGLESALRALADARRSGAAFLIAGGGTLCLLTSPDPARLETAMPPEHSPRWRRLEASILRELLITRLWGRRDDERDVLVVHNDAAAAVREADAAGGTAVICNPLSASDVTAIAAHGERVPRKSTSFGPKPRTGLILRTFAHG